LKLEESGELLLGGPQVAQGYLNAPVQTASSFLPNPFLHQGGKDDRVYRTGDVMRKRPDGTFVFLGRADEQVQLRGVRIELAEVEATLRGVEGVTETVVLMHEQNQYLVAFVSPPQAASGVLLEQCRRSLPTYMVPSAVIGVAEWPRTISGKIDRKALRNLLQTGDAGNAEVTSDSFGGVRNVFQSHFHQRYGHQVVQALVAISLVWQHWVPHDGGVALNSSPFWVRQMLMALTSFTTAWHVLAFFVGLMDGQQRALGEPEAESKLLRLLVLYFAIGLPRWLAPTANVPTFHRWTCLAYAELRVLGVMCTTVKARWRHKAPVFAAALLALIAPCLRGVPLIPKPAAEEELLGSIMGVIYEDFFFVDVAAVARLGVFYLIGFSPHVAKALQATGSWLAGRSWLTGAAFFVCCCGHVLWTQVEVAHDSRMGVDWPQYFSGYLYLLRMLSTLALAFCLLISVMGDTAVHRFLAFVGQNFLGTYLVHLYLRPNMEMALWEAGRLGSAPAQLFLMIAAPIIYILSIGYAVQCCVLVLLHNRSSQIRHRVWSSLERVWASVDARARGPSCSCGYPRCARCSGYLALSQVFP